MIENPADQSVLVVGASQAGVQIASSLRDLGHTGSITLIGAEPHDPYQRPPLSKALLYGEVDVDDLSLRTRDYYHERNINLVLGDRVAVLERRGEDGRGVALTAAGRRLEFDRLALTVGSRARKLDVPGSDLRGVLYLRDADNALDLKRSLEAANQIVVVGGGFIGLEVAASSRKLGKAVTVVLPSERILARSVGPETAEFIRTEHTRQGVRILTRTGIKSITGGPSVSGVDLTTGEHIDADLVVVGIGADPRVELAQQFGLACTDGIVVDEHALASDGFSVAAGDCANMPNPLIHGIGPDRLRLESVNNATEQAKVAAATLVGAPSPYRAIPWFWSDQFDLKLQVAGVVGHYDSSVRRGDMESGKFTICYYADGDLIAGECVNSAAEFMAIRGALLRGNTIDPSAVADLTVSLKSNARPSKRSLTGVR